jgi:hypothetical protein
MGASSVAFSAMVSSSSISSLCQNLGGVSVHFHETGVGQHVLTSPHLENKEHAIEPPGEASLELTPVLKQSEDRLFCVFDEHKGKSFRRRSDWKKHMNDFHKPDKKAWECPDCHQIFDQLRNFFQHHLVQHCHRNPCKHSATKLRYSKRAFACGRQFCERLLHSWEEWRDHVAEHLEGGMSQDEWQYNTLFRNLLRREEIHSRWEKYVSDQVGHYNIAARFNWRARNTLLLRLKLEYCEIISESDAERLVDDAYKIGLEVRTAHELLDPSTLITEPSTIRSQTDVLCYGACSQHRSTAELNPPFGCSGREVQENLQPSHSQLAADAGLDIMDNNHNTGQTSHAQQCGMSFEQLQVGDWWDGYDVTHESPILDFNAK